ncbi:unnamed protein product, partial [Nesidiocoris tenuis]
MAAKAALENAKAALGAANFGLWAAKAAQEVLHRRPQRPDMLPLKWLQRRLRPPRRLQRPLRRSCPGGSTGGRTRG